MSAFIERLIRRDGSVELVGMARKGVSTRALVEAPRDAVYVWPTATGINYAERLARWLGRPDIRIVAVTEDPAAVFADGSKRPIVFDHATFAAMSGRQAEAWAVAVARYSLLTARA